MTNVVGCDPESVSIGMAVKVDFVITEDGLGITAKCKEYLYPLIQGEAYPDYDERGMPRYVVLKNELVNRKLGDFAL